MWDSKWIAAKIMSDCAPSRASRSNSHLASLTDHLEVREEDRVLSINRVPPELNDDICEYITHQYVASDGCVCGVHAGIRHILPWSPPQDSNNRIEHSSHIGVVVWRGLLTDTVACCFVICYFSNLSSRYNHFSFSLSAHSISIM